MPVYSETGGRYLNPLENIGRGEIAVMLFNLLKASDML
jgi:hypothetical protein